MILVAYDGSADAQTAIDQLADVMPGTEAVVLTIWEPFVDALVRQGALGMGMPGTFGDVGAIDKAHEATALETATEGANRAKSAGLVAEPRVEVREGDVAETILAAAAATGAKAIAMGTRGRSGVTSFLLGSVSHAVLQHADRPVFVAPSAEVAERRGDQTQLRGGDVSASEGTSGS